MSTVGPTFDRVRRAMWDAREGALPERVRRPYDPLPGDPIDRMAIAALEVIREPSEALADVGVAATASHQGSTGTAATVNRAKMRRRWSFMIDAILRGAA